jgi:hypothetical protein
MSAFMLTAVLCVWLGVFGPPFAFDLGKWQPLVGSLITGAGVLVAAWNVTRQMRLTVRSQEYTRIERDLPGIRGAQHLVSRVGRSVKTADPSRVLDELEAVNVKKSGSDVTKDVEEALPNTPDLMRREIIEQIAALRLRAKLKIVKAIHLERKSKKGLRDTAGARELERQLKDAHDQAMIADRAFEEASENFLKLQARIDQESDLQRIIKGSICFGLTTKEVLVSISSRMVSAQWFRNASKLPNDTTQRL